MNFKELRDNFRAKKISAKEAVKDSLAKIKDDKLNIFINHFENEALGNAEHIDNNFEDFKDCLLYTSPSPRDRLSSRMPSSA